MHRTILYYYYYYYYEGQLSCHSVAVVLTLVHTKQIRINIHKRNNTKKHSTNNTKHGKYKYTYYQNTHTLQNPHIHTPTHYKTIKNNYYYVSLVVLVFQVLALPGFIFT
jgi:hypothetical protein